LTKDPSRSRNLANINIPGRLQGNLWPLLTTAIYNPYTQSDYSTGGDTNAIVNLIESTNDQIVIYVKSRMMNRKSTIVKDSTGFPVEIISTWTFNKKNGLIFVERTLRTNSSLYLEPGWRYYSLYFTRNNGFKYNGTFYFFNSTFSKTVISNNTNYQNVYDVFPVFPYGENNTFGIAFPFANTSIEGDGTHNVIITYYYDRNLLNVSEWKSDTSNILGAYNITWAGAIHEFSNPVNISTHTFQAVIQFTHRPINAKNVLIYSRYSDSLYPFMEVNLTTDKEVYNPGDSYTISVSGISMKNLTNITSKLTAENDSGVYFEKSFKEYGYTKGENFSYILFQGKMSPDEPAGNRKFTLKFISETEAIEASDIKTIIIS
jgi:hypothetical protein